MTTNKYQTRALASAINDICACNGRTRGAVASGLYMGERFVLVALKRPIVIEGQWQDVISADDVVDIFDLMDDFQNGRTGQA